MLRKTLTILSLLGLLLSVGLWGVSSKQPLQLICGSKQDGWGIEFGDGKLEILRLEQVIPWSGGKSITADSNLVNTEFVEFSVRLLVLAIISGGILTYCLVPLRRRRKRKKLGLCLKCGYDLRGSKHRCPECGEATQKNGALGTMTDGHHELDHR